MKRFRSETQPAPTQPSPTHVHHHGASEVGPILAKAFVALAGLVLAWLTGIYLLDTAGVYKPEQALAQFFIWAGAGLGLMYIVNRWFGDHLDRWYGHKEKLEGERTQQIRYQQIMTKSAVTDSRTSGDRQRLATLIYMIMLDAYDHYANSGPYKGSWRPWSRRAAGERVLVTLGETAPVGPEFGAKVRRFLEEQEVIKNDQIDLKAYPSIADIQRLIYQPVLLQANGTPDLEDGRGVSNWSTID